MVISLIMYRSFCHSGLRRHPDSTSYIPLSYCIYRFLKLGKLKKVELCETTCEMPPIHMIFARPDAKVTTMHRHLDQLNRKPVSAWQGLSTPLKVARAEGCGLEPQHVFVPCEPTSFCIYQALYWQSSPSFGHRSSIPGTQTWQLGRRLSSPRQRHHCSSPQSSSDTVCKLVSAAYINLS